MEDDERSACPGSCDTSENVEKVQNLVHSDIYQIYASATNLDKEIVRERPKLWPIDWILYHDSAPVHRVLSLKQFLAQK
jgi:hypothetical protein